MLKHQKTLRAHLAVVGIASAFAFTPLVVSPVIAQALNSETEDSYRIIESDPNTLQPEASEEGAEAQATETPDETAVQENQLEPYSDKMAAEEPAPTVGDPIASDDAVPMDSNALTQDGQAPAYDSVAGDSGAIETGNGVDPMTSASIPDETGGEGIYVLEQGDNQVLANHYIGKSVYNDAMEKVGEIRDLVFTIDGGIEAAVIGVGGFLGLGQKQVAVRFDEIRIVENSETAELELYLAANAEQLTEAPEFTTREDRLAESRAQETGSATGQPAIPLDPAGESTE